MHTHMAFESGCGYQRSDESIRRGAFLGARLAALFIITKLPDRKRETNDHQGRYDDGVDE
jgi:hypothetical protein